MSIEYKEKWMNLKAILKTMSRPKTIAAVVWLSLLPVGLALMWKDIKKMWNQKKTEGQQTKLTDWEA